VKTEQALLVRLSAAIAVRDSRILRATLRECALQADPEEVEEVILQSYLFLGYPIALNAFALWREISGEKAGPAAVHAPESWEERGEGVCQIVYGGKYEKLRANVRAMHPDMERWMVMEGYGKVLGRTGLHLATRELCIVALLSVLGAPRQLYSHLRGALNAGASPGEVDRALQEVSEFQDEKRRQEARDTWGQVLAQDQSPQTGSRD